MKRSTRHLILFLGLLVITACSFPRPVLKLDPIAEETDWWYGNQRIRRSSKDGLGVEVTYLGSQDYRMEFLVTIVNATEKSILVEPTEFRLVPLGHADQVMGDGPQTAIDPERELLEAELEAAQERSEQRNEAVIQLIDATADLVSAGTEDEGSRADDDDWAEAEIRGHRRLINLNERRAYWANRSLRKTNLPPGYEMSGTIQFRRVDEAPAIRIEWMRDAPALTVEYAQRLIRPSDLRN